MHRLRKKERKRESEGEGGEREGEEITVLARIYKYYCDINYDYDSSFILFALRVIQLLRENIRSEHSTV